MGAFAEEAAASLASGGRSAADVATLGYGAALNVLTDDTSAALLDGLTWLGKRIWFRPQQAPTLEADGISSLGLALAVAKLAPSVDGRWLCDLVLRSVSLPDLSLFDRSLFLAAAEVLGAARRPAPDTMAPCLRIVLARRGSGPAPSLAERQAAWVMACGFSGDGAAEAAVALAAINALTETSLPARLGTAEPADVVRLLEGVRRSMRRWAWDDAPRTPASAPARWEIANEYHVQDLLWAVLAPLFPDLNDEETLPPVGQKNPRADLTIPSLGTIVEVKFVRPRTSFQSIIGEVAEDASLYGTDPRWRALIPFVWDDSSRTEEHATLMKGLLGLPMVVGAVVVPRPQKMVRSNPADGSVPGCSHLKRAKPRAR